MQGVSKKYPGTLAVDNVSFEAYAGSVHALMGENGAGKSTLMKMLAGSFDDYTGRIILHGKESRLHTPALAKAARIEMIYQELSLALTLTVAENILAGRLPQKHGIFLDKKEMIRQTRISLDRVGLDVDPLAPVETLSRHEAQLVEIAKALANDPSILVMDEPTSSLSRTEVDRLFEIIDQLKSQGLAIIYISHHISEVFKIADTVTVMRDARKVDTLPIDQLTPDKLVEMMVGKIATRTRVHRKTKPGDVRFRIEDFSRFGFFHNVDMQIRAGEILGIAGLAGAGRTELARSICAIDPLDTGRMYLDKKLLTSNCMQASIKQGIAYLTEDRKHQGLALKLDSRTNALSALNAKSKKLLAGKKASIKFHLLADILNIRPPDPAKQTSQLSGGNQQKVLLAKWLATDPQVCIFDEPTRGVDIGAKQTIHQAIAEMADRGICVMLISSDLPELVALADNVMVMRKGRFIRRMKKDELSEDTILLAANGQTEGNIYE